MQMIHLYHSPHPRGSEEGPRPANLLQRKTVNIFYLRLCKMDKIFSFGGEKCKKHLGFQKTVFIFFKKGPLPEKMHQGPWTLKLPWIWLLLNAEYLIQLCAFLFTSRMSLLSRRRRGSSCEFGRTKQHVPDFMAQVNEKRRKSRNILHHNILLHYTAHHLLTFLETVKKQA
jgi:hypothetical protein